MSLPAYIKDAIKCGPTALDLNRWEFADPNNPKIPLTDGEYILRFALRYLRFPDGNLIGKPMRLAKWQQAWVLATYNTYHVHNREWPDYKVEGFQHISKGIASVARRAGKSLVVSVILLAYLVGPLCQKSIMLASAAQTREQAAILHRFMHLILMQSPELSGMWNVKPSTKEIFGYMNAHYIALSRDKGTGSGLGRGYTCVVLDEAGAIDAPSDPFIDMLITSKSNRGEDRMLIISTQAPSDNSYFSLEIDAAEREGMPHVASHIYCAPGDEITDESNWWAANPSLHEGYRNISEIEELAKEAMAMPSKSNAFLNLYMNRRVSEVAAWMSAEVWKRNNAKPDWNVFREYGVTLGLDLSKRADWTCACACARDADGFIHVYPYTFIPTDQGGLRAKENRDKMPYSEWAKSGVIYPVDAPTISYEFVANFLREEFASKGIRVNAISFDAWRAEEFFAACDRVGFAQSATKTVHYLTRRLTA